MLLELKAMGVDKAVLVSAREFGGSDTFATSQILAAAIKNLGVDKDDIIFCGRQAIDGDTGLLINPTFTGTIAGGDYVPTTPKSVRYNTSGTANYTLVRTSGQSFEGMTNPGATPVSAAALTVLAEMLGGSAQTSVLARELMLTGDFMPAKEALALGLLNKVVPAAEVLETAKKLAKKLAGGAPVAQREIMKAVRLGLEGTLYDGITKIEKAAFQTLLVTEDFKEGSKAFLEKRPAQFKGR